MADSDFVYENIPPACRDISRKLDCISSVVSAQCLSPEQIASIKQKLRSDINDLKHGIKLEQDQLKSLKDNLAVCKAKIGMIEKWEEECQRLDSVLPVVTTAVVNNSHQPQTATSGITVNHTGLTKDGILTFRHIEEAEWNKVPSYLKLRLKLVQVNEFIEALNNQLIAKYTLLKKKKSTLKKTELDQWVSYKEMETVDTKGLYFVMANDLKKVGLSEKTISTMSSILRHCHRMRELRTGRMVRLVVKN